MGRGFIRAQNTLEKFIVDAKLFIIDESLNLLQLERNERLKVDEGLKLKLNCVKWKSFEASQIIYFFSRKWWMSICRVKM